jgi:NADH:ubiquinone oxidoreductase subunit 6 (subunit J)
MLQSPILEAEKRPLRGWVWPALLLPPVAIAITVIGWLRVPLALSPADSLPSGFGKAEMVAELLLNKYLLAFELISIVLLVAIIGALSLGRVERRLPWR